MLGNINKGFINVNRAAEAPRGADSPVVPGIEP